jgi:hypothetical protein
LSPETSSVRSCALSLGLSITRKMYMSSFARLNSDLGHSFYVRFISKTEKNSIKFGEKSEGKLINFDLNSLKIESENPDIIL